MALLIAAAPQARPRGPIQDGATVAHAVDAYLDGGEAGPAFAQMLTSADPKERHAANLVLFNTGEPRFAARLVRLFADPDPRITYIALWSARRFPDAAWPILTEYAEAGTPTVFPMLRELGAPGMAEIRKHIHHPSAPARVAALTQLDDIGEWRKASFDPDPIVYGRAAGRLAAYPGETRVFAFTHPRVEVRREALKRVQRGTGTTIDEYVQAARDRDPWVRALALPELGRLAYSQTKVASLPEAIGIVGQGLADPHPEVRNAAVLAVSPWFQEWDATKKLWGAHAVQAALQTLRTKSARDALFERASLPISHRDVWTFLGQTEHGALLAMALVGDDRILAILSREDLANPLEFLPILASLQTHKCREWLSDQIARVLADRKKSQLGIEPYERDGAILAAALQFADNEINSRLRSAIRDSSVPRAARLDLLRALAYAQQGEAEAFLIGLLEDTTQEAAVRSAAAFGLSYKPSPAAIAALRRTTQDPDASVAGEAASVLRLIAEMAKGG